MTTFEWSRKYIFRRLGLVLILMMVTILYLSCVGCFSTTSRAEDRRQKEEGRKIMKSMIGNPDEAIQRYTRGQMQPKTPAKSGKPAKPEVHQ